jgi:hypothetical protein
MRGIQVGLRRPAEAVSKCLPKFCVSNRQKAVARRINIGPHTLDTGQRLSPPPASKELHMHATLAYLNAAGRRATRLTPSNGAFMRVMNTLLTGLTGAHGARPGKTTSPRPSHKAGKAGWRS